MLILRFCLVHFQFRYLILASLSLLCCPTRPWIWVDESAMHTNEIICCDWGLDVAAVESNLQFLGGIKGTCVFPGAFVVHSWPQIPPTLPTNAQFILYTSTRIRCSIWLCTSEWLDMIWRLLCVVKSSVYCSVIQLTSFAAAPVRWNNMTVMLFWPQSGLLGSVTWIKSR